MSLGVSCILLLGLDSVSIRANALAAMSEVGDLLRCAGASSLRIPDITGVSVLPMPEQPSCSSWPCALALLCD